MKHIFLFFLALMITLPAQAALKIVTSYPPIQSLVWSISEGVNPVSVMFFKPQSGGHHNVQLKPSDLRILQKADIVFWVGPELENFMPKALETVAPDAISVPLMKETAGLDLLPSLSDPSKPDAHFWMDIDNAILALGKIEEVLIEKDPQNAQKYKENKEKALKYLENLKKEETPNPSKKIVALHDGFEYMTRSFNLNATTLGIDPENITTPQAMANFEKKLKQEKPDCLIIEPTLKKRQIKTLGLNNYSSQKMDAFGWNIDIGAGQYYRMMLWNLNALKRCTK